MTDREALADLLAAMGDGPNIGHLLSPEHRPTERGPCLACERLDAARMTAEETLECEPPTESIDTLATYWELRHRSWSDGYDCGVTDAVVKGADSVSRGDPVALVEAYWAAVCANPQDFPASIQRHAQACLEVPTGYSIGRNYDGSLHVRHLVCGSGSIRGTGGSVTYWIAEHEGCCTHVPRKPRRRRVGWPGKR